MLALLVLLQLAPVNRTYWPATVAQLASGTFKHTHLQLDSVWVVYTAKEADGDFHMRLRDRGDTVGSHYIIAECIPSLPCRHPRVGEVIPWVRGIKRRDDEHGWIELHPVEAMAP